MDNNKRAKLANLIIDRDKLLDEISNHDNDKYMIHQQAVMLALRLADFIIDEQIETLTGEPTPAKVGMDLALKDRPDVQKFMNQNTKETSNE